MNRTFESPQEFAAWELEQQILEKQMRAFERHARSTLNELRCPVDPVAIYEILAGEKPFRGRARTRTRDRQRVLHAMHLLLAVGEIRGHVGLTNENATKAAYAALRAGYLANAIDAALGAEVRAQRRVAGHKGGKKKASRRVASQARVDQFILKHATAFRDSGGDYLDRRTREPYTSAAAYVREKRPALSLGTIRARLKALNFKP